MPLTFAHLIVFQATIPYGIQKCRVKKKTTKGRLICSHSGLVKTPLNTRWIKRKRV